MKKQSQHKVELVFKAHYKEFCLLSYSYTKSWAQAQDIVQDVFVKILTNSKLEEILILKHYLKRSVINASLNYVTRSQNLTSLDETIFLVQETEPENATDPNLNLKLNEAISHLPEQSRKVFELCALDGHKYKSAAKSLGISENTVKSHMKKAYKILRVKLGNAYFITLVFIIYLFLSLNN